MDGRIEVAGAQFIADTLRNNWGLPVITVVRAYTPEDVDGGFLWRDSSGEAQGLVTWAIDGEDGEIVTLSPKVSTSAEGSWTPLRRRARWT